MPIYEFKCDNCQNVFEKIRKYEERNQRAQCLRCCQPAQRISTPSLIASISGNANSKSESNEPRDIVAGIITPANGNFRIENSYVSGFDVGIWDGRVPAKDIQRAIQNKRDSTKKKS